MRRLALLLSLATCSIGVDRGGLIPLSMKRKLCDREPTLRICKERITVAPLEESYSKWILCGSRPDHPICRHHPMRVKDSGEKNDEISEESVETTVFEVPVVHRRFNDAPPQSLRSIEKEMERQPQLIQVSESKDDATESFESQPFEMDESLFTS